MKKTLSVIALAAIILISCQKSNDNAQTTLNIRLTDAPTALEEVNVDIQQVSVKTDNDTTNWISLTPNVGVYNLLGLQNGVDTLIATGIITADNVKEIRLILGTNNTVKEGGVIYPLTIPSGSESGLKIKFSKGLRAPIETVLVDFDAALSVKKEADGYKLRPVLRIK